MQEMFEKYQNLFFILIYKYISNTHNNWLITKKYKHKTKTH